MKKTFDLIIFPMHDWKKGQAEGFRTRDGHLMQHFDRQERIGKILVVDRPTTLPEMLLLRRRWRVHSDRIIHRTARTCLSQVGDRIYVLDIFARDLLKPLRLRMSWWDTIFRRPAVIEQIQRAADALALRNRVLFLWSPLSTGVIGKLNEDYVVFDALDNWSEHPGMVRSRDRILAGYDTIKKCADLMFANAESIVKFLDNGRTPVQYIPNGVNPERFRVASEPPGDIAAIPNPRIGYGGKLDKRLDVELMADVAEQIPEANFIFVGPFLDRKWVSPLRRKSNIYFLGDKHYDVYPRYIQSFDICLIPHYVGGFDADHLKLYEYLAARKPVVATAVVGAKQFEGMIAITHSRKDFVMAIRNYMRQTQIGEGLVDLQIPRNCVWECKAEQMINRITGLYADAHKG